MPAAEYSVAGIVFTTGCGIILDVKRATSLVTQNVDKIVQELEQKNKVQQDNGQRNEVKQSVPEGKVFYSSVAYLQSTDDTSRLDALREKGDKPSSPAFRQRMQVP